MLHGRKDGASQGQAVARHISGVRSVADQVSPKTEDRVLRGDFQFEIEVFTSADAARQPGWVEPAELLEDLAPYQQRAAIADRPSEHMTGQQRSAAGNAASVTDHPVFPVDDPHLRIRRGCPVPVRARQRGDLFLCLQPVPKIIGVEKSDEPRAFRGLNPDIAGAGDTAVGYTDHPETIVLDGDCFRDGVGVVGGAVIDEDDLDVCVALAECRPEGAFEEVFRVVSRDDDADERL